MRAFLFGLMVLFFASSVSAQDGAISVDGGATDTQISQRLNDIYAQLPETSEIVTDTQSGVVSLSGSVANDGIAGRAVSIAERIEGVVAVRDDITRTLTVTDNVGPLAEAFRDWGEEAIRALPLILAALASLAIFVFLGQFLSKHNGLIKRFTKNPFLVELMSAAIRILFIVVGLIIALNILGATALIGTILGGAGVIGIALGFGVRDTVENYIASLLLSLRQPFRAKDHVLIDGQEGIVVRLNTRATILRTLDGNHLRIPNAKVFKADILNYTTNPQRRFSFLLGIDSADDPVAAIHTGVETLKQLDFILDEPAPMAMIKEVGDSSILIDYFGWIDQNETDFASARSQAIRDVKDVLETGGFSLPEPLYRLRVEGGLPVTSTAAKPSDDAKSSQNAKPVRPKRKKPAKALKTDAELTISEQVEDERAALNAGQDARVDLLNDEADRE